MLRFGAANDLAPRRGGGGGAWRTVRLRRGIEAFVSHGHSRVCENIGERRRYIEMIDEKMKEKKRELKFERVMCVKRRLGFRRKGMWILQKKKRERSDRREKHKEETKPSKLSLSLSLSKFFLSLFLCLSLSISILFFLSLSFSPFWATWHSISMGFCGLFWL